VAGAVLALAILLGLAGVAAPWAQAQTFTTFDAPRAGTGVFQGTIGLSINAAGDIAGFYIVAPNVAHGFVRAADGTITKFDAPDAGTGTNQGTFPVSINTAGDIAGMYFDTNNVYHGFLRAADGTITEFDVLGAGTGGHRGTEPLSIDAAGDITGTYNDNSAVRHGFVRAVNGTITKFDVPGAGTGYTQGTIPVSINTAGVIAGTYSDTNNVCHGFLRAADGTITAPIDVPGAGTSGGTKHFFVGTIPLSINAAGDITGRYNLESSGVSHAFVRAADGTITAPIDVPGASTSFGGEHYLAYLGTAAFNINTAGDIAGGYSDASGVLHGFVRAANGNITTFDAPGAGTAGTSLLPGTIAVSINAAADIAGTYADASGAFHGFVLTPVTAATTTTLVSWPNPSAYGQEVTFAADVASSDGAPPDGQPVSFMEGTTVLGTGTLSGGSTRFTTSALSGGTDLISAVYGGDWNFAGSTSRAVSQVVIKEATTTSVISSNHQSISGTAVTFTATVKSTTTGTPTGTVTFMSGRARLGTGTLSAGEAKYTTSTLAVGSHRITAVYGGSTIYSNSTSPVLWQQVSR
jgi:hypothetical protein